MIQVLSPEIANQIAAGEVVERPASVVKELVENAIDAGATHIEVRIHGGGTELIQVADNGSGMSEDDAIKCFLRHATSKITSIEDLFSIQSFGFRGEALAAISSVSDFEIITKTQTDPGLSLKVDAGRITEKTPSSANRGTTISVRQLFHNTPARLGYLKTDETEYRQVLKEVQAFALSRPDISFQLFKEDKCTLDLPKADQPFIRVKQILKTDQGELVPLEGQNQTTQITGFVSSPGNYSANKNHQYIFVNGRKIEDHRLAYAAREAYVQSCGIEKHLYPLFVLFIQIDPIMVDVNVHPRKLEVKFSDPGEMFGLVKSSVIQAVQISNNKYQRSDSPLSRGTSHNVGQGVSQAPKFSSAQVHKFNQQLFDQPSFRDRNFGRNTNSQVPECSSFQVENQPGGLIFLAQVDQKYIIATNPKGDLFIFEQHALHERQRFDRFMEEYENKAITVQPLLIPEEIKLSDDELSLIGEYQKDIEALGFEFKKTPPNKGEESQSDSGGLILIAVPQLLQNTDFTQIFQDFIEYFQNHEVGENIIERLLRKRLEYKACRGSVMFGDSLTPEEGQQLLNDVEKSRWRDLCPHGRPHHVQFNAEEIGKWFHR
ncbi:MAG TPA: DNA mismatch repair endonuclease MutL [Candidatus Gracilibacteria bacterium]